MIDKAKDLIKTFESKIIYAEDVVRKFNKNEKMFSDRDSKNGVGKKVGIIEKSL